MIKIILVGDSRVGKSSYFNRLQRKVDYLHPSTIGVDYCSIKRYYGKKYVKVNIWDTAGQERYRAITNAYYRDAVGALLVYDITCYKSFESIAEKWHRELMDNAD